MSIFNKERQDIDLIHTYHRVFGTDDGHIILYDLMKRGFILSPTHDPKDIIGCHKNEGKRELVLFIMKMLETDPVKLKELIREGDAYDKKYWTNN